MPVVLTNQKRGSKVVNCQNSFLRCVKISFVAAFRGIWIGTDSNSILCYSSIWDSMRLLYMLFTNERKKLFLVVIAVFLDSNSQSTNLYNSFSVSIPKRLWNLPSFFRHF